MTDKTPPRDPDFERVERALAACGHSVTVTGRLDSRAPDTQVAPSPPPQLTFTLREATNLVGVFGGDDTEITVRQLPAGAVKDDPSDPLDEGPSPAGLWAHFADYPEEGCLYLGPQEVDDGEPVTPFEPDWLQGKARAMNMRTDLALEPAPPIAPDSLVARLRAISQSDRAGDDDIERDTLAAADRLEQQDEWAAHLLKKAVDAKTLLREAERRLERVTQAARRYEWLRQFPTDTQQFGRRYWGEELDAKIDAIRAEKDS